jgi:hypothetical protein
MYGPIFTGLTVVLRQTRTNSRHVTQSRLWSRTFFREPPRNAIRNNFSLSVAGQNEQIRVIPLPCDTKS